MFSGRPPVSACVWPRACVLLSRYCRTQRTEFRQTFVDDAVAVTDELIRFLRSRSQCQGRYKVKYLSVLLHPHRWLDVEVSDAKVTKTKDEDVITSLGVANIALFLCSTLWWSRVTSQSVHLQAASTAASTGVYPSSSASNYSSSGSSLHSGLSAYSSD